MQDLLSDLFFTNDVILFGLPGVGKTTLVEHLLREVPLRYVSLGSITRSRVEHGDEFLAEMVRKGGEWPLEFVLSLVEPYLNTPHPFVLDGFPKHPPEAEWLGRYLRERSRPTKVILLKASEKQVRQSAIGRAGRSETAINIEYRIKIFRSNTQPMISILKQDAEAEVIEIDGLTRSPSELVWDLNRKLASHGQNK